MLTLSSIACKKTTTENPPTQLRETRTSTDAIIGALGDTNYYKQNVILSFNGKVNSISAVDGHGNSVEGITYDSSTGIVNFDAITNNTELQKSGNVSNYTLTFSVEGETNGTFQIPVTLRKATVIPNVTQNNDIGAEGSLSYALSNSYGGQKYFYNLGGQFVFDQDHKFVITNGTKEGEISGIVMSNNQSSGWTGNKATLNQALADDIRQSILDNTAGNFAKYFSDVQITYISASDNIAVSGNKDIEFDVVFTPYFTNEMTNAAAHKLYLQSVYVNQ